jgi:hypothetical protein
VASQRFGVVGERHFVASWRQTKRFTFNLLSRILQSASLRGDVGWDVWPLRKLQLLDFYRFPLLA